MARERPKACTLLKMLECHDVCFFAPALCTRAIALGAWSCGKKAPRNVIFDIPSRILSARRSPRRGIRFFLGRKDVSHPTIFAWRRRGIPPLECHFSWRKQGISTRGIQSRRRCIPRFKYHFFLEEKEYSLEYLHFFEEKQNSARGMPFFLGGDAWKTKIFIV